MKEVFYFGIWLVSKLQQSAEKNFESIWQKWMQLKKNIKTDNLTQVITKKKRRKSRQTLGCWRS